MLGLFAKLATRSSQLRNAVLLKHAGILGAIGSGGAGLMAATGRGVMKAGTYAAKNPGSAAMMGLGAMGTVAGVKGAVGKYQQNKAGFDPEVQKMMLGQPPTPPGA